MTGNPANSYVLIPWTSFQSINRGELALPIWIFHLKTSVFEGTHFGDNFCSQLSRQGVFSYFGNGSSIVYRNWAPFVTPSHQIMVFPDSLLENRKELSFIEDGRFQISISFKSCRKMCWRLRSRGIYLPLLRLVSKWFTYALMIDIRMSRDIDGRIGSKIPMCTHCTEGMTSFTFIDCLESFNYLKRLAKSPSTHKETIKMEIPKNQGHFSSVSELISLCLHNAQSIFMCLLKTNN
jgi:hypothetical protein